MAVVVRKKLREVLSRFAGPLKRAGFLFLDVWRRYFVAGYIEGTIWTGRISGPWASSG